MTRGGGQKKRQVHGGGGGRKPTKPAQTNKNWSDATGDFIKGANDVLDALRNMRERGGSEAASLAEALVEDHPDSPLALHVLGHVRAALGEADQALPHLRRAAELAPHCLEIAFTLAVVYAKVEQFGQAAAECRRALDVVDPVDPRLHTVGDRRHMGPSYPARVAVAKEQLRGLLADALARSVGMARERWNGMSDEEQRSFLTVSVEDMEAYYQECAKPSEQWQMSVLADAVNFVTNTEAWVYLLCPQCNRVFLNAEFFPSHVEEEHTPELKELLSSVPKRVANKQTKFLESWISPKTTDIPPEGEAEGDKIVSKIKSAVLHLKDMKALSVDLVDKLVKFTKGWIGTAAVPKKLSCIASLDPAGLQVLGSYLERIQTSSRDWLHERAYGGEQNSHDAFDVVIQIQDARILSVDIENNVSTNADGSSNADVLFNWLCRYLREEPVTSWSSMRQDCIAKGTEVLQKIYEMTDLLMKQVELKSSLSEMNEDYFRTEASVDVEILRMDAEVDYLKKKLVEVCSFDYHSIILPVMKAYLWAKLNSNSPGKGLHGMDDKVAEESLTNRDDSNVFDNDSDECPFLSQKHNSLHGVDGKGAEVSPKKRGDSIAFHNVGGEPLPEDSTVTTAKLINDSTGKSLPNVGDKGAEGNHTRRDDSPVFNDARGQDLPEDSNAKLNSDPPGKGKGLSEVDDKGDEGNLETTDNLNVLHKVNDEVLPEDHDVLQYSDRQLELPPRAREQNNLGDSEQTSMTSQDTSDFGSRSKDQPRMAEETKHASSSDFSGSTKGIANISINGGNSDSELQSLNVTLLSLWHLRWFSDQYRNIVREIPHFGVSGNRCVICLLHQMFSAWESKDDRRATIILKYMRTAFTKILNDANVSQKEETNFAVKITEIIFKMMHTSQTALPVSCDTGEMTYQTIPFSSCPGDKCFVHSLFGMRKNEENEYTFFVNLDASELLNIEMKSFSEVIKAVNKRFHCDTESSGYNHLPRFFTTVFRQPSDKESHLDVSGLLVSMAAPLDISPVYEGLRSECKYTVLSAVFRAEDRDVCFAREQEKWRIYDDNTVKDADSWENVLDGYNQSRLYPQIIFFERHSSTTD